MARVCNHPVTRFSSLEPSVRGAMKLWHRCVNCGLPVLVKVYYGQAAQVIKAFPEETSYLYRNREPKHAA